MKIQHQIALATGGFLLAGAIAHSIRTHRRDRRATAYLQAQREMTVPGEIGTLRRTAFNPDYLDELVAEGMRGIISLPTAEAKEKAQEIKNAWGVFDDDEETLNGIFRKLDYNVHVSQVAKAYEAIDSLSLLDRLKEDLSETEFGTIKQMLVDKPDHSGSKKSTDPAVQIDFENADSFDPALADSIASVHGKSIRKPTERLIKDAADTIYDSWSVWGDDEEEINKVLQGLLDKYAVSKVAAKYETDHGKALKTDMKDRLSEEEWQTANSIAQDKKPFTKRR